MTVFDYINSISFNKVDLYTDPFAKDEYNSFIVNKYLSYFPEIIFYANEMNFYNTIPNEWQFKFFLHIVPKRKRFVEWDKKDNSYYENISAIKEYYKYSTGKAIETLPILTEEQLIIIKKKTTKGGQNDK